jgi:hypothetical protein
MNATLLLTLLLEIASAQLPHGVVSIVVPDGWRRVDASEQRRLKPELRPQNKMQERLKKEPSSNEPLLVIKHDTDQSTIAASAQLFVSELPAKLHGASSIEAARVIAFAELATYRAKYEVEPHEITAGGLPAAEWVATYQLVETIEGAHDMRTRQVVITRGEKLYLLGYSGPAADAADFAAFDGVVKSLRFSD